jgi:methylase of polypeptide subunit release factors
MKEDDCFRLSFLGMEKLGPGGNEHTREVLRLFPAQSWGVIVDAGCGTDRQTITLAKELGLHVHAVDVCQLFLDELVDRAKMAGVAHQIQVQCVDMFPSFFNAVDQRSIHELESLRPKTYEEGKALA